MRLMIIVFSLVFLLILDQSTFKGYYMSQVVRLIRYCFAQLGV